MDRKKKLAFNSEIQTYQVSTNNNEVCVPSLSRIFLAVQHPLIYRINSWISQCWVSVDIWWRWKLETNRNVHFLIEKLHYIIGLTLLNVFYQYLNNVRRNVHRAAAWQKLCIMPQLVSNYVDISPWTLEKFKLFFLALQMMSAVK